MSDHNKCPSSEKEHEKCIFRFSYFHRIQPSHNHENGNDEENCDDNSDKSVNDDCAGEHSVGAGDHLRRADHPGHHEPGRPAETAPGGTHHQGEGHS